MQEFFHALGLGLCHQLPERSFFAAGIQFPVCARDTGMYLGFVVALSLLMLMARGSRRPGFPAGWSAAAMGVLFGTLVVDGLTSYTGLRETTNLIRLATGVAAGFALASLVAPIVADVRSAEQGGRVLATGRELVTYLSAAVLTFAAAWWALPLTGIAYPLLSSLSIVATFTSINAALVLMARRYYRVPLDRRKRIEVLVFSVALAVLEIGSVGVLRTMLL